MKNKKWRPDIQKLRFEIRLLREELAVAKAKLDLQFQERDKKSLKQFSEMETSFKNLLADIGKHYKAKIDSVQLQKKGFFRKLVSKIFRRPQ